MRFCSLGRQPRRGTACSRKRNTRSIEPELRRQLLHDIVLVQTREKIVRHAQRVRRRIDVNDHGVVKTSNNFSPGPLVRFWTVLTGRLGAALLSCALVSPSKSRAGVQNEGEGTCPYGQ